MKLSKVVYPAIGVLVIAAVGVGSYMVGSRHKPASSQQASATPSSTPSPSASTSSTPSPTATLPPTQTPQPKTDVHSFDIKGLLQASYTRNVTTFTALWEDSPVTPEYRDFNSDSVNDVFVWAKIPGTMGYSFAAIWTVGSDNKPKELWFLPSDLYLPQSSWVVNATNTLVNSGKKDDGGTIKDATNNFHWQKSTTGESIVLEPNM